MHGHTNVKFVQAIIKIYGFLKYYKMCIINCHKIMVIFTVYCCLLAGCFLVLQQLLRYNRNCILSCKSFVAFGMCNMNVRTTLRF